MWVSTSHIQQLLKIYIQADKNMDCALLRKKSGVTMKITELSGQVHRRAPLAHFKMSPDLSELLLFYGFWKHIEIFHTFAKLIYEEIRYTVFVSASFIKHKMKKETAKKGLKPSLKAHAIMILFWSSDFKVINYISVELISITLLSMHTSFAWCWKYLW